MIVGFIVVDASVNENENENIKITQSNLTKREGLYFDDESNEENLYEQILKIMEKKNYQYDKFTSNYYRNYKTYELEEKIKFNASKPIPIPNSKNYYVKSLNYN